MTHLASKLASSISGLFGAARDELDSSGTLRSLVDLTDDNDEEQTERVKIQTPSAPPQPVSRRSDQNYTGAREQIDDPYPHPPPPRPVNAVSTRPNFNRKVDKEEARLLGRHRDPKDAVPIKIPNTEPELRYAPRPTPIAKSETASMSRKPGSTRDYMPRNTLSQTKYQRQARATNESERLPANARESGLAYEVSRGANVRHDQHDVQDSDRPLKRQKLHQHSRPEPAASTPKASNNASFETAYKRQISRPISSGVNQVSGGQIPHPTKLASWEVSGVQESRRAEKPLERQRSQQAVHSPGARMASHDNADRTAVAARPLTRSSPEVHEISDDEQPGHSLRPVGTVANKRGRPIRDDIDLDDEVVQVASRRKIHPEARLSEFYNVGQAKRPRRVDAVQRIDSDREDAASPSNLKSSVVNALKSPDKSEAGGIPRNERQVAEDTNERRNAKQDSQPTGFPSKEQSRSVHPKRLVKDTRYSDEEDEIHGDGKNQPSVHSDKSAAQKLVAAEPTPRRNVKTKTTSSQGFTIAKLVDMDGKLFEREFRFLELRFSSGIAYNQYVCLYDQVGHKLEPSFVLDPRNIRKVIYSATDKSLIMRIELAGRGKVDIEFHDYDALEDFLEAVKHVTTIKDVLGDKSASWMKEIFGKRDATKQMADEPVDLGQEEEILARRIGYDASAAKALKRAVADDRRPRPRQTLRSQMKPHVPSELESAHSSLPTVEVKQPTVHDVEPEVSNPSMDRPTRTSIRRRKPKSPTPEPHFERYSKIQGLGDPWDQPLVYPEVGKKRVTVDFTDLERLDEGEFLNDNLLEFYIRWLQENRKDGVKPQTAYFFGTHFFTTLSDTSSAPKRQINYSAVERWTAKDDIFSHDFVIVPVNEMMHWYLAIICNLPNVLRKLENRGEDGDTEVNSKPDFDAKTAPLQQEDRAETAEVKKPVSIEADIRESSRSPPTKGLSKQFVGLTTSLATSVPVRNSGKDPEIAVETETTLDIDDEQHKLDKGDQQDSSAMVASQPETSQLSQGLFSNAAPASPEKRNKIKRKSGPPPRKYDVDKPMIVIMDPMGTAHQRTVKILKEYLVLEAQQKRGMEIDRDTFQGMTAKSGIPQQDNYYDCGIYVLGYLDKFMQDPYAFGRKLLAQEFEQDVDWPDMQSGRMRAQMRSMLQDLAKEQMEARAAKRSQKRALRQQAAAAAAMTVSSPPAPRNPPARTPSNTISLLSPEMPVQAPPSARQLERPEEQPVRSSPKQSRQDDDSVTKEDLSDGEMLFKQHGGDAGVTGDYREQLAAAANVNEDSSQEATRRQRFYIPDSQSQGGRQAHATFDIYDEETQGEVI